jgi:heparin/heparan-sulfate lyase
MYNTREKDTKGMTTRQTVVLGTALIAFSFPVWGLQEDETAVLHKAVVRGAGEGKVTSTFINFGGTPVRVTIKSGDDNGLTVDMAGTSMAVAWGDIEPKRLAGLAAKCVDSAAEWWALADLYMEIEMKAEAEEAYAKAAGIDPVFKEKLDAIRNPKPAEKPKDGASAAAETASGTQQLTTVPEAPPEVPGTGTPDTNLTYPPYKGKTPARGLRTDRPRLLITPDRLQFLKQAGRSLPSYGAMRTWCKSNPRGEFYAPMQALVYVIEGSEEYGRMAIDNVKKGAVEKGVDKDLNSCFPAMGATAIVYDWCYPLLSKEEKDTFIKYMVEEFDAMQNTYKGLHYHNYNTASAYAFAMAGYALGGDDPKSGEMIKNAVRDRFESGIMPEAFMKGTAGGAWAEGEGYSYTTVPDVIYVAEAARTCEGVNEFEDPRGRMFFYNRLAYMMFATYPGKNGAAEMVFFIHGDGARGGNTLDAREGLLSLAYAYNGTRLAAYAQDFIQQFGYSTAPYRDGLWNDVLWGCPGTPRLPIRNFRLSHHAQGMGVVLMKSDWTEDAAFVSFICGDHYSYHAHADSGAFTIVRYGQELAVDSGEYDGNGSSSHAMNYHSRTIAHNSIVLAGYDASEAHGNRIGPADDGGQIFGREEGFKETGNIIAYDPQRAYTYVVGDVTPSFTGRVSSWVRHILFIRPDVVVVMDVVSANPAHYPRWLLHTWNEPEIAGTVFRAEKGPAAIMGQVLLPQQAKIEKVGGPGKEWWVAGKNYPPPAGKEDTAKWRIEVSPGNPAQTTAFLVVLQPTKNSVKEMIPCTLLTDGSIGCQIGGATVRFNPNGSPGGTLILGGQTFNLATRVMPDPVE